MNDTPPPIPSDRRWRQWIVFGLSLTPAYFILLIIQRYAVNMPTADEWYTLVDFYVHPDTPISSFWALYNDHRVFLQKLLPLLLARLTGMNLIVQIVLDVGLAAGVLLFAYLMYRKSANSPARYLVILPFSLLCFSLSQYPMWSFSVAFATYCVEFFFVASLAALICLRPGWRALLLAGFIAILGSLTLFPGNLIWPIGFIGLWAGGYRRKRFYLAWVGMAALVLIPYITDYLALPHDRMALNPIAILHFTLALIGSPLAFSELSATGPSIALPIGIAGLVTAAVLGVGLARTLDDGLRRVAPWLAVIGWVLEIGVFGGLGRVTRFGALSGRQFRFTPYGALFWVAVVALIALALSEARHVQWRRWQTVLLQGLPAAMTILIAVGYMNGTLNATEGFDFYNDYVTQAHACLWKYKLTPDDCMTTAIPDISLLDGYLPQLITDHVQFLDGQPQFDMKYALINTPLKSATGLQVRKLDGVDRTVLFQHPPSTLTWQLIVPQAKYVGLKTGVLVDIPAEYEAPPSDGAVFEVWVSATKDPNGPKERLFQRLVLPRKVGEDFTPIEIDLSAYAGKVIVMSLVTSTGLDDKATANYDWALWLPPSLVVQN